MLKHLGRQNHVHSQLICAGPSPQWDPCMKPLPLGEADDKCISITIWYEQHFIFVGFLEQEINSFNADELSASGSVRGVMTAASKVKLDIIITNWI